MKCALLLLVALAGCGGGEEQPRETAMPASAPPGLAVWAAQGCGSCHRLAAAGSTAEVGPALDGVLRGSDADEIAARIVSPPSGSMMPDDFGERMTDRELADLASFLAESVSR